MKRDEVKLIYNQSIQKKLSKLKIFKTNTVNIIGYIVIILY